MSHLVIIGGGFAGVWSAASAARLRHEAASPSQDLRITLIAPGEDMVIRPRLYEPDPDLMRVPLHGILKPIGVEHVRATVHEIDTTTQQIALVHPDGRVDNARYDKLIVACGSTLLRPRLPGSEHLFDVDTLPAATVLDKHLRRLPELPPADGVFTAVVVGAGFTGLEVATELVSRLCAVARPHGREAEVRVVLVEYAPVVGPELGPGPREAIESALTELGIEVRLATTVTSLDAARVQLLDGSTIPARTVVWTAGMRANALTRSVPASRDRLDRIEVDRTLRVRGIDHVYAAGDAAAAEIEQGRTASQSCQHAHAMGKHAGHNAAAELLGLPAAPFDPAPYVTCLDLGDAGAVFTTGWERTVASTGLTAKGLKRQINQDLIYPPTHDQAAIFKGVDHLTDDQRAELLSTPVDAGMGEP